MTDNEDTRTTFRHEDEAETGCYETEAEAENFGRETTLAT